MLEDLFGIIGFFYLPTLFLGAVSIGYLVIRITYPDVRIFSKEKKLGISALLGFLIALVSLFSSLVVEAAISKHGLVSVFVFAYTILAFTLMRLYFFFNSPSTITVGVPLHSVAMAARAFDSLEIPKKSEQPQKPGPLSYFNKPLGMPSGIVEPTDEKGRNATQTNAQTAMIGVQAQSTPKTGPGGMNQAPENWNADFPAQKPAASPELKVTPTTQAPESRSGSEGFWSGLSKMFSNQQGAAKPKVSASEVQKTDKIAMKATELPQQIASPERPDNAPPWVKLPREQATVTPSSSPGLISQKSDKIGSIASQAFTPLTPQMLDKKKTIGQPEKVPIPTGLSQKKERQVISRDEKAETALVSMSKQMVFPSSEDGSKLIELEIPIKQKSETKQSDMFTLTGSAEEAKETIRKAKEAEAEMVLTDIVPQANKLERDSGKTGPLAYQENQKVQQMPSASGEIIGKAPAEPVHRRYEQHESIRVIAPKDVMETDEFNTLITDIYSQLKHANREDSFNDSFKVNTPPERQKEPSLEKTLTSSEKAPGQMGNLEKEMFGSSSIPQAGEESSTSLFDQLNRINESEGKRSDGKQQISAKSDVEFVHIKGEKGLGCPNCHQKNSKIVFCPYCGSGMCANCSPNVKLEPDGFCYTCPKCTEEVHIKKKREVAAEPMMRY